MRRDPLLYSDHSEVEDINTIEPIEVKRSFMFYFIVLANTLLVVLVLLIIWSLFTKPADTSFDQQLKTWTQNVFSSGNDVAAKPAISLTAPAVKQEDVEAINEAAAEAVKHEEDLAVKAETEKLEALALKLKEEKVKAAAIQQSINEEAKAVIPTKVVVDETPKEQAVVPNAAKDTTEQPSTAAKTQLEQILETMQNQ
ncbi:hypothetical protein [Leucothrix arctica]|uniref:Uncharacterized protein n=1 Tax=Leucothrix arctica TaxID=1481894 RepID=A0A317CQ46_9GAMM|nr:hypothetical protein [Leucothrix arctica]PWQ98520.1 hypothetical protein DKT75_03450 [Leucothrix arctica]